MEINRQEAGTWEEAKSLERSFWVGTVLGQMWGRCAFERTWRIAVSSDERPGFFAPAVYILRLQTRFMAGGRKGMEVRPQGAREGVVFSWTGCFRAAVLAAAMYRMCFSVLGS